MSSLDPSAQATAGCGVRLHELQRRRVGELEPSRAAEIDAHAVGCPRCKERLLRIEADEALAVAEAPSESARILERLERPRAGAWQTGPAWAIGRRAWLTGALALTAAAAAGIVFLPREERGGHRIKGDGGPSLEMYVRRSEGPVRAEEGIGLTVGDQVQFRYQAAGKPWLLVLSVDGRGAITSLYPADGGQSVAVEPTGARVLEGSIILDDAVGVERVLAFFSDRPLSFAEVRPHVEAAIAKRRGDLRALEHVDLEEMGTGVAQATLWFQKM